MSVPYVAPALALLLRLKLRGMLRRQARRLRTFKGLVLTLIGCLAFVSWAVWLAMTFVREQVPLAPAAADLRVRGGGVFLLLLSLTSALANRGLYIPRTEIERLFSAPLARADLVRYRLLANGVRSLLGGVLLGLFGSRRMPEPALAFAGILLAMQTLPVVNQIVAIALGGLERGPARVLKRLGHGFILLLLLVLGSIAFALATDRPLASVPLAGQWLADLSAGTGELFGHPLVGKLTAPLTPWARMIAAPSLAEFLPWFLACLALHVLLIELCARVPLDFRELSLQTSARAAARVARMRRGGGVAATRASAGAARWSIPWLFGRSPEGAIAWRKCAGMARKAKGALWVALVALLFITIFASLLVDGPPEEEALFTPCLIALLGTVYLCSGLRFDFREELERMDVIRSWPLPPARVFMAMLLPEVVLVSLLVAATVLIEAALSQAVTMLALLVVVAVPFAVFTWVALDNLVFLFAPVRLVPGQDGFVQLAGRRMIQGSLLLVSVLALGTCGFFAFIGARGIADWLGAPELVARVLGFTGLVAALATGNALLVLLGGAVLRRFDVARDRG